jgi:hypothetical protein
MSSARDIGLNIAAEAYLLHHDRDIYGRIVDMAKSKCDPDHWHVTFFTYRQPMFMQQRDELDLSELNNFIRCMHGKSPEVMPSPALVIICIGYSYNVDLK